MRIPRLMIVMLFTTLLAWLAPITATASEKIPQRVVILNPETLDIADALGINVIGVAKSGVQLPELLRKYQDAHWFSGGTLFEPDYEALSHYQPDLILAGGRARDATEKLRQIAPTVELDIDSQHFLASLTQRTQQLATMFAKQPQAEALLAAFNAQVAALRSRSASAGRAMVLMVSGGKTSVYGSGSRFGFIYDVLGFQPASQLQASGRHGNVVSAEFIMQTNPDWLFVLDRDSAIGSKQGVSARAVLDNALVQRTAAWQKQQVIWLDSSALYLAGGIQSYRQLMNQLQQVLAESDR